MSSRRFAFSNIAWAGQDEPQALALLRAHDISGIEVAPTVIWPDWLRSTPQAAARYRRFLHDEGFEVPALQAILYSRPQACLFDEYGEVEFLDHLEHVATLAEALGAPVAVLGAPRQRDRGLLTWEQALTHAVPTLREAAGRFADHGSCLCIEPNPRQYGCNFVCNAAQGAELVRMVDHPGFGLHLDAAALHLEGENLAEVLPEVAPVLKHFHLSEPNLGDFRRPEVPHLYNLQHLDESGYQGWCSVEMRRPPGPLSAHGPWKLLGSARNATVRAANV
jgi:D-psicose/D-tagatose/L-ribulose 3-epimerase